MSKTKKKKSKNIQVQKEKEKLPPYLLAAIAACAVMVVVVIISSVVMANRTPRVEFIPPEFEANAIVGTPDVSKELGYGELFQDGMSYSAWICGAVYQEDDTAVVYFTNPKSNGVWLKLRITDEQGNILGESGLIKPGEYVRAVTLTESVAAGTPIKMRVMGYEPETYNSVGSVSVKTEFLAENNSD